MPGITGAREKSVTNCNRSAGTALPGADDDRLLSQRWWLLVIVAGVLLLMGFYTVTDPARLSSSHLLQGADYAGYAICHRITERSFTIAGRQLPLCARCTGIYLGISLTFLVLLMAGRARRTALPPLRQLLVLGGFLALMGVDGLNSYSHFFPQAPHLYEPRNWLRLTTGAGAGLTMGLITFPALAQTLWHHQIWQGVVTSWRELAGLVGLIFLLVLLVLSNQPALLYVLGIVSAAGVLLILTAINAILLLIALRKDGRAARWQEAAVPLTVGLSLALLEIGAVGVVRFQLTGTLTGFPGL
ncbi:MAG: DUF2085 domain-containing protein [Candidatus Promineifilaceae bacterium]|nr:DUF2085 domain-containing protein [Candidatus Promineifilaceae bacterium]